MFDVRIDLAVPYTALCDFKFSMYNYTIIVKFELQGILGKEEEYSHYAFSNEL